MSSLGIDDDATVIAYDDQGGVIAARLVWMLRVTGHEAALLDGGIAGYAGPVETGNRPSRSHGSFVPRPWPAERLADIDDASDPANLVLDARSADRYRGENEVVDARAGHIPGAVSFPCRDNIGANGKFLPAAVLRERFEAAGVTSSACVVSYCGSGVTACHNLLALEMCGFEQARLYPGSWSEYSAKADRPVAT